MTANPTDRRTLRRGPRPGVGGRPKKTPTRRISARMPEPEYAEFRQLSDDMNENQAILRAIRLWMAIAKQCVDAARTGESAEKGLLHHAGRCDVECWRDCRRFWCGAGDD